MHTFHKNLLTTMLKMNISVCIAVVPDFLLRFGDIVKQIFSYECRPISVSTAYLLILQSTGVQEGSRKRIFCCNTALPVSMQWSTELCWIGRNKRQKIWWHSLLLCLWGWGQTNYAEFGPNSPYKEGGNEFTSCKNIYIGATKDVIMGERVNWGWPIQRGKVCLET